MLSSIHIWLILSLAQISNPNEASRASNKIYYTYLCVIQIDDRTSYPCNVQKWLTSWEFYFCIEQFAYISLVTYLMSIKNIALCDKWFHIRLAHNKSDSLLDIKHFWSSIRPSSEIIVRFLWSHYDELGLGEIQRNLFLMKFIWSYYLRLH